MLHVLLPSCSLQSTTHICGVTAIGYNGARVSISEAKGEFEISSRLAPLFRRSGQ